ncbi:hypothetical protein MTO96_018256 [Rhipicephalus appendiculatus]
MIKRIFGTLRCTSILLHFTQFRTCLVLALATCAFAGYVGYPYTYSVAAPTYAAYHAPISAAVSTVHHSPAFTYGYGYPHYAYGLGSYGLSYGYGLGGLGYTPPFLKKCECNHWRLPQ